VEIGSCLSHTYKKLDGLEKFKHQLLHLLMFKAFLLNFTSIHKSPKNPHKSMRIDHSPHTHSVPIPMESPMEVPMLTTALSFGDKCLSYSQYTKFQTAVSAWPCLAALTSSVATIAAAQWKVEEKRRQRKSLRSSDRNCLPVIKYT